MNREKELHLHIISFNVPYPPDYGGVIDVFNKIKWLSGLGVKIHLHTFVYNRPPSEELTKYCEEIIYYPRETGILSHFSLYPYIVYSRRDKQLLKNLHRDTHPVLFEGLHSCYYLQSNELKNRLKIVRLHNIEHLYYYHLAKSGGNLKQRLFHLLESVKLRIFERVLHHADLLLAISSKEMEHFQKYDKKVVLSPPFHAFEKPENLKGKGDYILLHGNLSVAENIRSVKYLVPLIREVCDFPVIIAGKSPSKAIYDMGIKYSRVTIAASPESKEMYSLIKNAHLIVLHTSQATGVKLKLTESIYLGRFVIANIKMLEGSGMEGVCERADTCIELKEKIKQVLEIPFDEILIQERREKLALMSNKKNAGDILGLMEKMG